MTAGMKGEAAAMHRWSALHTEGTTRVTLCIGRYAIKVPKSRRGCLANCGELIEWKRATPERREIMCPLLWSAPFGLINIMQRAIPLPRQEQQRLLDTDGFPDWDYMPGGPSCPFEYKESDWGYVDGRLVALDYPAKDVMDRWDHGDAKRAAW
jgi:hypothetical protein